jgi:hypothetical protein
MQLAEPSLPCRYRHRGYADHDPCRRRQGFAEKQHAKRDAERNPQIGLRGGKSMPIVDLERQGL